MREVRGGDEVAVRCKNVEVKRLPERDAPSPDAPSPDAPSPSLVASRGG